MVDVNLVALLVAVVLSMVVGFVWYSPMLFGNQWMKLMKLKKSDFKQSDMAKSYGLSAVASLVMAYVLSVVFQMTGVVEIESAMTVTFWLWLGFVATTKFTDVLFANKRMELFALDVGYQLASLLSMAAVLVLWK